MQIPNGFLFVTERGGRKSQQALSQQIEETIARGIGLDMTPHQFRHLAAYLYLGANRRSSGRAGNRTVVE